jgi:hypothetical protein
MCSIHFCGCGSTSFSAMFIYQPEERISNMYNPKCKEGEKQNQEEKLKVFLYE